MTGDRNGVYLNVTQKRSKEVDSVGGNHPPIIYPVPILFHT